MNKRLEVTIYGQVQGVTFRYSILNLAEKLGLTGWVRNEMTGTVLVLFEGEEKLINKALQFCHQGPPSAKVSKVDVKELTGSPQFGDFQKL